MPSLSFTANLQRHVACSELKVEAASVSEALEQAFAQIPKLRGYIVDEQGALHRHMAIMVNGEAITDRRTLNHPLQPTDEIYILQALSGG